MEQFVFVMFHKCGIAEGLRVFEHSRTLALLSWFD